MERFSHLEEAVSDPIRVILADDHPIDCALAIELRAAFAQPEQRTVSEEK